MIRELPVSDETAARWNEIAGNNAYPFLTYAWHRSFLEHFPETGHPVLLLIDGTVIAPLVSAGDRILFSGGKEIADYLDLIGPDESKASAWQAILLFLKNRGVTGLTLYNVPGQSATVSYFRNLAGNTEGIVIEEEDTTPTVVLPGDFESYLSGLDRHARHEIRRKLRKFRETYPDIVYNPGTEDAVPMETLLTLMRHNPDKRQFLTAQMQAFFRELPVTVPGMRVESLRKGDTVIAAKIAFPVGTSLLLYNSGYDPVYENAGLALTTLSIEHAIAENRRTYNFLQGSERYKYDFGGRDHPVYTLRIEL